MVWLVHDDAPLMRPDPALQVLRADQYARYVAAEALYGEARQAAAVLRAAAHAEYEQERRRGYAQGQAEARAEAAAELLRSAAAMQAYYAQAERALVTLLVAALQKLVGETDAATRAASVVHSALAEVSSQAQATLWVAPEQLALVRTQLPALQAGFPAMEAIALRSDAGLAPDTCRVETEIGCVEIALDEQLAMLCAVLAACATPEVSHAPV